MEKIIEESGYAIYVNEEIGMACTVGLSKHGLSELICGFSDRTGAIDISVMTITPEEDIEACRDAMRHQHVMQVSLPKLANHAQPFEAHLVPADDANVPKDFVEQVAAWRKKHSLRDTGFYQVVIPDQNGLYPWCQGYCDLKQVLVIHHGDPVPEILQ